MSGGLVFTVVVPTIGRIHRLGGCLAALDRLDYPRDAYEVVLVNDGDDAEVDRLGERWSERLQLTVLSTPNAGPSAARNAGTAIARGRFIAFTDDDCEPEPGWLSELQATLEANPGSAVGGALVNGAPGRWAATSQVVLDATHAFFNRDPDRPTFFASSNLAFPAGSLQAVGGFDEGFLHAEDREMCERWLQTGRTFVQAPGAVVRHMREFTPRQFWSQHFGYGRGAWSFRIKRHRLNWGTFRVEPRFYRELARELRRPREGSGRLSLALLAVVSQVATACGFVRESLSRSRSSGTRRQLSEVRG